MKISNFLTGLVLGIALTVFFMFHRHTSEIEQRDLRCNERISKMSRDHQTVINNMEDIDEACTELFERNMELETAVVVLNQTIIQDEVNCLWRINQVEKECCQ